MKDDPYGVPTGGVLRPTPIQEAAAKAVDDYLLMERKARAWDALLRVTNDPILLATMNAMVHPAQGSSTS